MPGSLYTLGYATPGAMEQLELWMEDPMTLLVDVRLEPRSRWYPAWNKSALRQRWGTRYTHEHCLGNVYYREHDKPIRLRGPAPEETIARAVELLQAGYTLVLLCVCRDSERCHRMVVLHMILDQLGAVGESVLLAGDGERHGQDTTEERV